MYDTLTSSAKTKAKQWRIIGMLLLVLFGCSTSDKTNITETSEPEEEEDTSIPDTQEETGTITEPTEEEEDTDPPVEVDCSSIANNDNWELCEQSSESCSAVFYDGAGCHAVCSSVGLGCMEIWDNLDGECLADTSKPELGCDVITGHDSDYCVCAGPPTEPPECVPETEQYEDLLDELVGFGANTTGGAGGSVCTVTTTSNSGSGSLRNCIGNANSPTWIRFSVDGDINLNSNISLPNNITIDARGHYIRIFGGGFTVHNGSNIIITNLIFKEGPSGDDNDAIQVKGGNNIWVHHCSFSNYSDGLLDLTKGTRDVTVSWNKFSKHDKVLLISAYAPFKNKSP